MREGRKRAVLRTAVAVLFFILAMAGSVSAAGTAAGVKTVALRQGKTAAVNVTAGDECVLKFAGKNVTWKSSAPSVASVSSGGKVTVKAAGKCTVTASDGKRSAACTLKSAAFRISTPSLTMLAEHECTLKTNGTGGKVTFLSSRPSVARVSASGKVCARKAGKCTVTAVHGSAAAQIDVTVLPETMGGFGRYYAYLYAPVLRSPSGQPRILLAGSSSMRNWSAAETAFAPCEVINTAVTGSKTTQWLQHYRTLITRYHPDAVVIYVGANDINNGKQTTGRKNAANTVRLLKKLRSELKTARIYYVSICTPPAKAKTKAAVTLSNRLVRKYCASAPGVTYIDIASRTQTKSGKPDRKLFQADGTHPNAAGYRIWQRYVAAAVRRDMLRFQKDKE